jgi:hypothetical protein
MGKKILSLTLFPDGVYVLYVAILALSGMFLCALFSSDFVTVLSWFSGSYSVQLLCLYATGCLSVYPHLENVMIHWLGVCTISGKCGSTDSGVKSVVA